MNERKARALLEEHFVEPLAPRRFRRLWEHVSGCAPCRAHYDRLMAFEGRFDAGRAEVERIGDSLFEQLEAGEREGFFSKLFSKGFAFTWPFPTVIAGAAAALALMLSTRPPAQLPGEPVDLGQFGERGGPAATLSEAPELLGACFLDRGQGPESPANLAEGSPLPACPRGGRLALAYRRARPGDRLAVFALGQGAPALLVPAAGAAAPALTAGPGTSPLHGSFAIAQDAAAGEVQLVAVFGPALDLARLAAVLGRGEEPAGAAGEGAVVHRLGYRVELP